MKAACVLLICVASVAAQTPDYSDVSYAGWSAHKLDIYLPSGTAPFPTVVYIHGGGWYAGDKAEATNFVTQLTDAGFAVVAINYRLSGSSIFPAQIHDCKAAIRWLKANGSSYNLDTSWIGVWGFSAGGHLALLLGASNGVSYMEGTIGAYPSYSSSVDAVVSYAGPTDIINMAPDVTTPPGNNLTHDASGAPAANLLGYSNGMGHLRNNLLTNTAKYTLSQTANPLYFLDVTDPPVFVAHGTDDMVVPIRQSEKLVCLLQTLEVPVTYEEIVGGGHPLPWDESVGDNAVAFLVAAFGG